MKRAARWEGQAGQVIFVLMALATTLFMTIPFVIAVGHTIHEKLTLQRAVDAAAVSAATWQARGLNVVADLNYALVAAGIFKLVQMAAGGVITGGAGADMKLIQAIQKAQDIATKTFPGAAGLHYRQIFKANASRGMCWPLPTGIKDAKMFSLRLRRVQMKFGPIMLELWMEEDRPNFWDDQLKRGPLIRLMASREERPWPFAGSLLGERVPAVYAAAQAAPWDGTMWDPDFAARLTPLTADLPGVSLLVLH